MLKTILSSSVTRILLIAAVALAVSACKKEKPQAPSGKTGLSEYSGTDRQAAGTQQVQPSIRQLIESAQYWQPAFQPWYGKKAPDFTLQDINGKKHQLSSLRGKDVLLVFWATWCGPCKIELPHLIAIRNLRKHEDLAILAISSEPEPLVRDFARSNKLNYTIISANTVQMPQPYSQVNSIPASFFISKSGNIKLATVGPLSLGDIRNILNASE